MVKILSLWTIPGGKITQFEGLRETGEQIVRLNAPAHEGKANAALIDFLAKTYGVPKRNVKILSGEKSRKKRVEIHEKDSPT